MEDIIIILILVLFTSLLIFLSIKELKWYSNGNKENVRIRLSQIIRNEFSTKNFEIIQINNPRGKDKKQNPFDNGINFVLPGFFGPGERLFFWVLTYKKEESTDIYKVYIKAGEYKLTLINTVKLIYYKLFENKGYEDIIRNVISVKIIKSKD